MTEFAIPDELSNPVAITAGGDSNLWFTDLLTPKIGRVTPDGIFTVFTLPPSRQAGTSVPR